MRSNKNYLLFSSGFWKFLLFVSLHFKCFYRMCVNKVLNSIKSKILKKFQKKNVKTTINKNKRKEKNLEEKFQSRNVFNLI